MNPLRVWIAALCLGALGAAAACSGDDFTGSEGGADGGGSGGVGGSAGSTNGGSAGAAGTGASGGSAGSTNGGSAGAGGSAACVEGQCGADSYCHSDGSCRKCTDLDEMDFDTIEPLSAINAAQNDPLLWPRPVGEGLELVYVAGPGFHGRKIWFTPDFTQGAGAPLPPPFDVTELDGGELGENAPLITMPMTDGPLKDAALFFDRAVDSSAIPGRRVWGAKYDGAKKEFLPPQELPDPFNVSTAATWNFALAPIAKRAWFVSNRENVVVPKLHTLSAEAGGSVVAAPVPLVTSSNNCPVSEWELTPWVTIDGSLLFFQASETNASCQNGPKSDLFVQLLLPSGQAAPITAIPLPVNLPNSNETSPGMSPDMCWLYFSSDRELPTRQRLYRARRI